jgi:hypothetical protein
MLRLSVLLLALFNAGYYAWSHQMLRSYGFGPAQQSEPQRQAQQIQPQLVRILSADEARRADGVAQATPQARAGECLQSALLDDVQAVLVRQAAQAALPAGSWTVDAGVQPARWIVYMGKYADAQALAKKRGELASLNLRFEPLTNPALDFGLSLGGYDSEQRARTELAALAQRGVRTATVVQEHAELRGSFFRVPAVDDVLRPRLDELKTALAGQALHPCK